MRFSVSRVALGVCGMLLLAGCAEPESTPAPKTDSPVASTRTKPSAPDLDLASPFGASDDAAMLRQAPDYSITPSALTSDSTMGVASGVGVDPLLGVARDALPGGDLHQAGEVTPHKLPTASLDLENAVELDLDVRP